MSPSVLAAPGKEKSGRGQGRSEAEWILALNRPLRWRKQQQHGLLRLFACQKRQRLPKGSAKMGVWTSQEESTGKLDLMPDDLSTGAEPLYPLEEMVTASELREFLFCERAWVLSKQGYRVSAEAESQRAAGIVFHQERALAASKGASRQAVWWAALLIFAAIALLCATFLMKHG
jgi:hypothetical protein